jgi:hypothetical protein
MQINIKIAAREFHRLREQVPADSVAREAFDKATRIDHSLEGVLFAGLRHSLRRGTGVCDSRNSRAMLPGSNPGN